MSERAKNSDHQSLRSLLAIFASGNLFSMFLRMLGGVLAAKLVLPSELGLFSGIGLVLGYLPFLQLGALNGMGRQLPLYIGQGEPQMVEEIAATGQAWALLIGCTASLILAAFALWHLSQGSMELAAGWGAFSLSAFFLFYVQNYLNLTFRTSGDFKKLTYINVFSAIIGVTSIVFVWLYKYYGLCVRTIVMGALSFVAMWWWRPMKVKPKLHIKHLRKLINIGLPIFGVGQFYALWILLNSTLVLQKFGAHGFGLFQLSIITMAAVEMLPISFGQILYPRMVADYGKNGSIGRVVRMVALPVAGLSVLMLAVLVIGWIVLPYLVNEFLVEYVGGIESAQWSLVAACIMCFSPFNNVFNVLGRQRLYAASIAFGIVIYAIALLFLQGTNSLAAFPQALIVGRVAFYSASILSVKFLQSKHG